MSYFFPSLTCLYVKSSLFRNGPAGVQMSVYLPVSHQKIPVLQKKRKRQCFENEQVEM